MKYGYFPGCSLHGSARELGESIIAIAGPLGLELTEIDDWACCGASSAHSTNHLLGLSLAARTLALTEEQHLDKVLAPCAACYSRLASARHELAADPRMAGKVRKVIRRRLKGSTEVINLVQLLDEQATALKKAVQTPLTDLKVACYYGCLLVRPAEVTGATDIEEPGSLQTVVRALGATPISWNMALECCGGGFSLSRTSSVLRLGRSIIEDAHKAGAQTIIVACPMCHSNLDFRQEAMARRDEARFAIPILHLSQLVGLALGLERWQLGLQRHFIDTLPITRTLPKRRLASPARPALEAATVVEES